jgi:hypothetical protein
MKKHTKPYALFIFGLTLLCIQNSAAQQDSIAMKYASTITVEDLKEDLTILSSDALEGRETGKRGQKMAAAYIRAHFEELGLEGPVKKGNGYYQDVPLVSAKAGTIYLKLGSKKLINLKDFMYLGSPMDTDEISTEVVFLGNGSKQNFENKDLKGKSILVINSNRNERRKTTEIAKKHGVDKIFVVTTEDQTQYTDFMKRYNSYFDRATLKIDREEDASRIGTFYLSPDTAAEIFKKPLEKLTEAISEFDAGNMKAFKKIRTKKITYKTTYIKDKIISENVLGYLEGSEFKDEVIVMTAHYDHEGIKNGEVYNGADDDGSGTVAIMEMAEAFVNAKKDGYGPRRSILFMTVTGEEKGLLGSEYYTDNAIFPLENTVVNLNMDMIGRIGKDHEDQGEYIRLIGSDALSTELHAINESVNKLYTGLFLDYSVNDKNHSSRSYYRSDHWNFAKNGIPIISYGNGPHADYHKPTDTVDKILFELLQKRAQLIFHTAWEVANRDERIVIDKE